MSWHFNQPMIDVQNAAAIGNHDVAGETAVHVENALGGFDERLDVAAHQS